MPAMAAQSSSLPRSPAPAHPGAVVVRRRWTPERLLGLAVGVSVALHALLLTIHFRFPEFRLERQPDKGLEVVLVNARHPKAPEQAEALAQANLDGGGNVEGKARPSTPLPPQDIPQEGDSLQQARRRAVDNPARRQEALTRKEPAPASLRSEPRQEHPSPAPTPLSGYDLMDSAAAMARMDATIDKSLGEFAQRPRKKFIGARTSEYRFAQYVEDWRQKIERIGTLNYPEAARGRTYGNLVLTVIIRADGSVVDVEINRPSGQPVLDEAARRIVMLAAPYAPFPPDIRRDTDVIEITRTWSFTQGDQMRASQ